MHITCQQSALAQALNIISHAVPSRPSLPILSNVLIEATAQQGLRLSATNMEMSIILHVESQVEEAGVITLPAKLLSDFISGLPVGQVEIIIPEDSTTAQITSQRIRASIKGRVATEFPKLPECGHNEAATWLEAAILKEAIHQVAFAAAIDDSRPALAGILIHIRGRDITLAAADTFRLAVRVIELPEESEEPIEGDTLIPAKTLTELARILPNTEQVEMITSLDQVIFRTPTLILISRLIEGSFPPFERMLPESYITHTVVETRAFAAAVKTASFFAQENYNMLRIKVGPAETDLGNAPMCIEAIAEDTGDSTTIIPCYTEGPEVEMIFNAKYLGEALAAIRDEAVALETTTAAKPGLLKPLNNASQVYMVMPMHTKR